MHNIAVLLNEPTDDADLPDEVPEVDVYDGPQQGLTIRNHICNIFWLNIFTSLISLREIEKLESEHVVWATGSLHLACLEPLLACLS